jgi:hypothetical protein
LIFTGNFLPADLTLCCTVGLVPTTLFLVYFTLISTICPLLVAEAMALIPGNDKYQRRIEFVNLVEYYFGKKAYYVFQIMLAANLSSSNLASIRVSAQVITISKIGNPVTFEELSITHYFVFILASG